VNTRKGQQVRDRLRERRERVVIQKGVKVSRLSGTDSVMY